MSLLWRGIEGIRALGWRRGLEVIRFTADKLALDFRDAPPAPRWSEPGVGPGAVVESSHEPRGALLSFEHAELEVRFLAADLVRVTWYPGADPVPYALAAAEWPMVELSRPGGDAATSAVVASDELRVVVGIDGEVRFELPDGTRLRTEPPPRRHDGGWAHRARLVAGERIHGLGERAAPFDLRGGCYSMWNSGAGGSYGPGRDPLYLCVPAYFGRHAAGSYLVFFESSYRSRFAFEGDEAEARFDGGALRYYLAPGPLPRAMSRYADLTGRPPLPPRWALGNHQSRWGYASGDEIRDVVAGFRRHRLPLDAVHLDIDHMDDYRVFTVDHRRFPDLAGLADELAADNIRLVVIVDPGLQRDNGYRLFREARDAGLLCRLPDGRVSHGVAWPGSVGYPDFTDPEARAWWARQYATLAEAGVAGVWHDMNEPAAISLTGESSPPLATRHAMEGRGGSHLEGHNVYGLLMARAGHDGLSAARPDRRPFILSRSGWAGLQRYAWAWTGDTESSWRGLRQTVATVLGLSVSGITYVGPDVGGFAGDPTPELYLRWLQLSAFLPLCRTHSSRWSPPREPWVAAGGLLGAVRHALELRRRIAPYLYTLAWGASLTGHPLIRPLWWDDANPAGGLHAEVDDAFLLGPALLVAPVLDAATTQRPVVLPPGRWSDLWSGATQDGGVEVMAAAPLERIPVFVRGGTMLSLEERGGLVMHIYPDAAGSAEGVLYRDAGDGYAPGRVDRFRLAPITGGSRLSVEGEGAYRPEAGSVAVIVHLPDGNLAEARVDTTAESASVELPEG